MKTVVYNQEGKKTGEISLPKEIFKISIAPDLVWQIAVSQQANRRQGIAHAKDRSEVRGGGRKPWAQKGTGRARHGSIRSPIWRGGGVTFGPSKDRVFKKRIPKKMKRKALLMVLSAKAEDNKIIILEDLKIEETKTKVIAGLMNKLPCKDKSVLIGLSDLDKKIVLAARNIPKTQTIEVRNLNVLDLLSSKYLVLTKDSLKKI